MTMIELGHEEMLARRRLRRIRVLDALGESVSAEEEVVQRDVLLPAVMSLVDRGEVSADELAAEAVDAAVSVALATVDERPTDRLTSLLVAAEVLASDEQFSRLRQLAPRFGTLREDLSLQRPLISLALAALQQHLLGRGRQARTMLTRALGLDGRDPRPIARRSLETLVDLHVVASLRDWLVGGDTAGLGEARANALRAGNGTALEVASFAYAYASAVEAASLAGHLEASGAWPATEEATTYIERRGMPTLLAPQAMAIAEGVLDPGSAVVAMPTSSGKTFLAELKIVATLMREVSARAIYLAPYRLLSRQVEADLRDGLRYAGFSVRDMGSVFDISIGDEALAEGLPDVAIMTPERLDALTRLALTERRGASQARDFLDSVRLVVFDEVHLISRAGRGPRLELFLTRWKRRFPDVPVLALSGVVEGIDRLGEWLDCAAITGGRRPTGTIELLWRTDGSLVQRFDGTRARISTLPRSDRAINDAAELVLKLRDELAPVLVLETTRPNAVSIARRIVELSPRATARWREALSEEDRARLERAAQEAAVTFGSSHDLAELLRQGVAYHHAGVPGSLLRRIEDLASRRLLRAVCATTTVAEGAHLPFRVVIIPHLNFQGGTGRLERSLYLNVLGRAGRAGVAVEGIVIVLDSDSRTLKGYVARALWNESERLRVRGHLTEVPVEPASMEEVDTIRSVESQVLAWLGEPDSHGDDQARRLAASTLSGATSRPSDNRAVVRLFDRTLETLEDRGLARAASPYRLTDAGERARLAGLGAFSCVRLRNAISNWPGGFLTDLVGVSALDDEFASAIATTLFEAEEVLEGGLWLRRVASTEAERVAVTRSLRSGRRSWPYEDENFIADTAMLTAWIRGDAYEALGRIPPIFRRGMFGGTDAGKRAADAAELLGRLSYPAAWTWSAVSAMLGVAGESLPPWIRRSIEYGVPGHVGVELIEQVGLTRSGAVAAASLVSSDWDRAADALMDLALDDLAPGLVADSDLERLLDWQTR
jgi:hypothetical protein